MFSLNLKDSKVRYKITFQKDIRKKVTNLEAAASHSTTPAIPLIISLALLTIEAEIKTSKNNMLGRLLRPRCSTNLSNLTNGSLPNLRRRIRI
jgi:hypothetical protein